MLPQLEKGDIREMIKSVGLFNTLLTLIFYWTDKEDYQQKMKE
jgi:hypothetical protein